MDTYPLLSTFQTAALTLSTWEAYDPSVKVHLTSTALRLGDRLFLFDPIPLPEEALEELNRDARPNAIFLTNGNHERHALALSQALQVPVYASEAALPEFSRELARAVSPLAGTELPLEVIPLPGGAPGETAYYTPEGGGIAIVGDALIHLPTTGFCLLPEKYCDDVVQLRESVRTLARRPLEAMAFAHGRPLVSTARESLAEKIAALPEEG